MPPKKIHDASFLADCLLSEFKSLQSSLRDLLSRYERFYINFLADLQKGIKLAESFSEEQIALDCLQVIHKDAASNWAALYRNFSEDIMHLDGAILARSQKKSVEYFQEYHPYSGLLKMKIDSNERDWSVFSSQTIPQYGVVFAMLKRLSEKEEARVTSTASFSFLR